MGIGQAATKKGGKLWALDPIPQEGRSPWLVSKDKQADNQSPVDRPGAFDKALAAKGPSAFISKGTPRFKTKDSLPETEPPVKGAFDFNSARPSPSSMNATPRFAKSGTVTMYSDPGDTGNDI